MSVSTEVQRTLVKSPPELWTELSSPERLGRHFSEVGEIRVTKVEPELKVEWEADDAAGVVELEQSGWGTRVTLTLTRELPVAAAEPEPEPEPIPDERRDSIATLPEPKPALDTQPTPEPALDTQPKTKPALDTQPKTEPALDTQLETEPALDSQAATEPVTEPIAPSIEPPEPRQGFFARLFKRRRPTPATTEPEFQSEPQPQLEPEPMIELQALALPEPVYPSAPSKPTETVSAPDLAAELAAVEAQIEQESTEMLTGILDRLGAAHHRPFSRG